MVCPLCLEWGPETKSGFCAACEPPITRSIVKNHRKKLRLRHCRKCGRPFVSTITHNKAQCPACRDSCRHCGKPVVRKGTNLWSSLSCPECISEARRAAVRERHRRHPVQLEVKCRNEDCDEIVMRPSSNHRKRRYCPKCHQKANRAKADAMNRRLDGRFLPQGM